MQKLLKNIFSLADPNDTEKDNMNRNESVLVELQFAMFRQFAWLGSTVIGAIVVLIQLKIIELQAPIYRAIFCFAFSIGTSIFGQIILISSLSRGKSIYDISTSMTIHTYLIVFLFGFGFGALIPKPA